MTTQEFTPGTKVHVEFDAIVEEPRPFDYIKPGNGVYERSKFGEYGYGFLKVRDTETNLYHYVWSSPFNDVDLVTVVHQTDWEKYNGAQVGDIWEANGHEYFAYNSFGSLTLYPVEGATIAGTTSFYASEVDEFAALNPRLVRRRGEEI
jgi:hypothetical protein